MSGAGVLPETERVYWRPRVDARRLAVRGRLWTATTTAHVVPFLGTAGLLMALEPLSAPVAAVAVAHAWAIPDLYARRGANVLKRRARRRPPARGARECGRLEQAERVAAGLLGDLVGHDARALHGATGLVVDRGALGVWVLGEAGAVLVAPGGRRAHCFCVGVPDPDLPSGDRIAHLLLALREDEAGFATVANLAFSGARWRVRRRLPKPARPALDAAARLAAG